MSFKVAIVPGHGGNDPGGTGPDAKGNIMRESKINLNVALKLKELLEAHGIQVAIARTTDSQYLSPSKQLAFVNKSGANLAIAIHQNDAANESAKGTEVYYQSNSAKSQQFATLVFAEFMKLGTTPRGLKTFGRNIAVMKAKVPTILTERVFLTKADAHNTDSLTEQHNEAIADFNAIMRILGRADECLAYNL